MEIELREFKRRIKKVNGPRVYSIRNSLGVYDAYKQYRKTKPKDKKYILSESQYFSIIRRIAKQSPHTIKVQSAPCQKPVSIQTIRRFKISLPLFTREPPSGK